MTDQKALEYLCIYDPEFGEHAEGFLDEFGLNAATEPVTSYTDIFAVASKYALVRYLEIVCHGTPGMVYFKKSGKTTGAMTAKFLGESVNKANMLCMDARVLFLGCNVADGTTGDTFLKELGNNMFKGSGGTVGATTVLNFLGRDAFMNPFVPFDARLKVRRFDANGDLIGSRNVNRWGTVMP